VTLNRPAGQRLYPQIGQNPRGVGLAGGFHDPGNHQALGPCGHLEVENTLILGNKTAGPLQQNPQLPVGGVESTCAKILR
jgi:hypothetical protein